MSSFKSLNTKKFAKTGPNITPDTSYWKNLSSPVIVKEYGTIDYIDFSPVEPYYFAVTCSLRVQIYNPITKLVAKNISKFQNFAHGGTFGKNGQLLVAGDDDGHVRLFNVSSKNMLRLFRGHRGPVRRCNFLLGNTSIVSFSNDKTVKLWDMSSEKCLHTFNEHTDYVRAGCVSPISPNIILSGGYDNQLKMYDTRINTVVMKLNHGNPIESLLFLPTGGIFLSAGGTDIKVWDVFAGGNLLTKITQHHKTVTDLKLASNGKRLLSSGIDRHVKVYDITTYQAVHNFDYSNAVMSIGIAPKDETLVAGLQDGVISIQRMEQNENEMENEKKPLSTYTTRFVDETIEDYRRNTEAKYDKWLRKYEYGKALDKVLLPYVVNKNPHITVALMQELIRRKGLERAFANRSDESILKILNFIIKYLPDYRFTKILLDITNIFLNVYEDNFSKCSVDMRKQFLYLAKTIRKEETLTIKFLKLQGAMEILLIGANVSEQQQNDDDLNDILKPSDTAKDNTIIVE